jgi:hypothetical protein
MHVEAGTRRVNTMKKFGFASVIAAGFVAAVVGLAAPAQADHGAYVNGSTSVATPPHVDTSVHN